MAPLPFRSAREPVASFSPFRATKLAIADDRNLCTKCRCSPLVSEVEREAGICWHCAEVAP